LHGDRGKNLDVLQGANPTSDHGSLKQLIGGYRTFPVVFVPQAKFLTSKLLGEGLAFPGSNFQRL